MKKGLIVSVVLALLIFSCSTNENREVEDKTASTNAVAPERHEYWPLENEETRVDDQYHVIMTTHSLNDSTAIHTATYGMDETLVHAHNWETEIEILKNQQPYIKAVLTRDIFQERDEANELKHSGATFQKYENGEFLFGVDACIPDSDVCDAAVVAVERGKSQSYTVSRI